MAVKIKLRAQRIMRKLKLKGWIVFMCFSSSLWLTYYWNFIFIENECNNLINCNWVANMNNLETKNGRLKAHLGAWIKFFFFFGCIRKFKPNYFLLKLILGEVNNLRKNVTDKVVFGSSHNVSPLLLRRRRCSRFCLLQWILLRLIQLVHKLFYHAIQKIAGNCRQRFV
jgi:hypothetical protein